MSPGRGRGPSGSAVSPASSLPLPRCPCLGWSTLTRCPPGNLSRCLLPLLFLLCCAQLPVPSCPPGPGASPSPSVPSGSPSSGLRSLRLCAPQAMLPGQLLSSLPCPSSSHSLGLVSPRQANSLAVCCLPRSALTLRYSVHENPFGALKSPPHVFPGAGLYAVPQGTGQFRGQNAVLLSFPAGSSRVHALNSRLFQGSMCTLR